MTSGVSPDKTIDALYAFTDCEVSISPNSSIIDDDKPVFIGVSEILKSSTDNTLALLKKELEIKLEEEVGRQWHFATLERFSSTKKCISTSRSIRIKNLYMRICINHSSLSKSS